MKWNHTRESFRSGSMMSGCVMKQQTLMNVVKQNMVVQAVGWIFSSDKFICFFSLFDIFSNYNSEIEKSILNEIGLKSSLLVSHPELPASSERRCQESDQVRLRCSSWEIYHLSSSWCLIYPKPQLHSASVCGTKLSGNRPSHKYHLQSFPLSEPPVLSGVITGSPLSSTSTFRPTNDLLPGPLLPGLLHF